MIAFPLSGFSRPVSMLMIVVFPEPLDPRRQITSPPLISIEKFLIT
jgi:hypothetical protein